MNTLQYTLLAVFFIAVQTTAQEPRFTKEVMDTFSAGLIHEPAKTIDKSVHDNYFLIYGEGKRATKEDMRSFYTHFKETRREISDLQLTQSGNVATGSGILAQQWHALNDPSALSKYKCRFIFTAIYEKGRWQLLSAQHTDLIDPDEKK